MRSKGKKEKKIQSGNRMYSLLRYYVDFSLLIAYRKIKYYGKEKIPKESALIYSPNHTNALMDALVVLAIDKSPKVFVARADIFKNPTIAKILHFLKIMPINRIRDGRSSLAGNEEIFQKSVDVLKDRIPFCILPEGTHNAKHSLLPLGKGIFRIALSTYEDIAEEMPLYIVPIGIEYGSFFRYRSTVLVQIGDPIDVGQFKKDYPDMDNPELMNVMKDELDAKMKDLILYVPDDQFYNETMELCTILFKEQRREIGRIPENRGKGMLMLRYLTNRKITESVAELREKSEEKATELFSLVNTFREQRVKKRISQLTVSRNKPYYHSLLRIAVFLLTSPYFIYSLAATFPVLLTNTLILMKVKDKAFHNSIRFVVILVLWPLLLITYGLIIFFHLKWYFGLLLFILTIPALIWVQDLLRNIRLLVSDLKLIFSSSLKKQMRNISSQYRSILSEIHR